MPNTEQKIGFIDNSRLITESLARAGADVFVGYPITPANLLYYYSSKRFSSFFAAPDEITTIQLMTGFAASGRIPVTATSFPGFALMIESINMAYMMELPMVIILVQRLGPATGTATGGAQGDISMVANMISGGLAIPVLSVSDSEDNWNISAKSVEMAVKLRTPVILVTSKEEVMTQFSFDLNKLDEIKTVERKYYNKTEKFKPYLADNSLIPDFLPLTNTEHQIRFTASTHDANGNLQNTSKEALENTYRLHEKVIKHISDYTFFEYDQQEGAETIILSYGITALASKVAVEKLRAEGIKVSLLIAKTLFPIPPEYYTITEKYKKIVIAEENLTGQYRQSMFGNRHSDKILGANKMGKMIDPEEIVLIVKL
jgi:2-oxoglutarate ferredoxin oxidoreductase subunit alpha